jgi:hypothetical protein
MQQPLRRGLCETRGGKDSVARIVAEIPTSAVGEHDSQIRRYVLSEECCDSFIGEEVAEILQVETAQTVLLLQSESKSCGNGADRVLDFHDENMDGNNWVVCEIRFDTSPEHGMPPLVPNRRLDDSCKKLVWADGVLLEQMVHSELEKYNAKLNVLVYLPNEFAFGIIRGNLCYSPARVRSQRMAMSGDG